MCGTPLCRTAPRYRNMLQQYCDDTSDGVGSICSFIRMVFHEVGGPASPGAIGETPL